MNTIDQKSVDFGTSGLEAPSVLTQDEVDKARIVTSTYANSSEEFQMFMDMLGILPKSITPKAGTTPKRFKKNREYSKLSPEQKARKNERSVRRTRLGRVKKRAEKLGGYTPDDYKLLHELEDALGYPRTINVRVFRQFELDRMAREEEEQKRKLYRKRRRMERVQYALRNGGIARDGCKIRITPQLLKEFYEWERDPNRKRHYRDEVA
ncbi:MAG TPA: hypothetical protein VLN58_02345 [Verrucomicrobiae bacterium]|nr:hypothetical protein [Verrucomicrobiae bacterium]